MSASADRGLVVTAGVLDRLEQRAVDDGAQGAGPGFQRVLQHVGLQSRLVPHDFQRLLLVQASLEADERAVTMREMQQFSGSQAVQASLQSGQRP